VRLRFQADEDFNQTIVLAVIRREPGIDFQTTTQAGFKGRPDPEVLVPQHLPIATVVEELILLWYATEVSEWTNRIAWLPL
jgi:hypothetical protein